jgi:hypothetical protein
MEHAALNPEALPHHGVRVNRSSPCSTNREMGGVSVAHLTGVRLVFISVVSRGVTVYLAVGAVLYREYHIARAHACRPYLLVPHQSIRRRSSVRQPAHNRLPPSSHSHVSSLTLQRELAGGWVVQGVIDMRPSHGLRSGVLIAVQHR